MSRRKIETEELGVRIIREPTETGAGTRVVDIVAIHGIGAHPRNTWSCQRSDGSYLYWLEDDSMLPKAMPQARIMRYGYESQWFGDNAVATKTSDIAPGFLRSLERKRRDCPDRPLIIIAHCFGGLVILKAMNESKQRNTEWPWFAQTTIGLVFLGVPFRGSEGMHPEMMLQAALQKYAPENIQAQTLEIMHPRNEYLADLVDIFMRDRREADPASIACFFERYPSNVRAVFKGEPMMAFAVDQSSGCLDLTNQVQKIGLTKDHYRMNKYQSPSEDDYETVVEIIQRMATRPLPSSEQTSGGAAPPPARATETSAPASSGAPGIQNNWSGANISSSGGKQFFGGTFNSNGPMNF